MEFRLLTSECAYTISNVRKVKGFLSHGVVEVFDRHQDLMGLVENNLVEIELNLENAAKEFFALQNGIFIVFSTPLGSNIAKSETIVYVYAKAFLKIEKNTSIEELLQKYEHKKFLLNTELQKFNKNIMDPSDLLVNSKALMLKEETEFLQSTIVIAKKLISKDS